MSSQRTLNQLIASVINGAEDAEVETSAEVMRTENAQRTSAPTDDVEKLASALEFIGQRGVESFVKTATAADKAPPATNAGVMHKGTSGHQVTSTKHAPPMKGKAHGKVEDNSSGHPGGTTAVDTKGKEHKTHHPALGSNEAAINASPTIKEKEVASSLGAVLDAAGGDANHQKMKKVASHNLEQVRAELARRVAEGRA